ncbi:hypothetical protein AFCA_004221 [Aspergillus flavus]|uniref:Uncharacterized protein n=1 Tax=Aspergillus flavus TaxID=5059 RepID=A0AB74C183_ASPFL|nr:hypothetical protein CA14_000827 [Aspergillus flavus]UDD56692.1 hypothetical protein AFCA_004221 [Aspergillus flavus]
MNPTPKTGVTNCARLIDHEQREEANESPRPRLWNRESYFGSLIFNLGAFALPALYRTLSKLWIANIDSSQVVTTDIYTYIGVIVQVLNDGFPRSAWLVIGDKSARSVTSRLSLSYTIIVVQTVLGTVMTGIFLAASNSLAAAFMPVEVRQTSLKYVRISSIAALSSALETAVSCCTRALDHPDVPLFISSTKFIVNIILDLLILSKVHPGSFQPTVNTQAWIRVACDMSSALCGLGYFLHLTFKLQRSQPGTQRVKPSVEALKTLIRPSSYTFAESAIRNAIYLWLVSRIVLLGENYATAWGVFNTIRWGLVMVPVQALEQSTLTFVGHNWGVWRDRAGVEIRYPKATKSDIMDICRPAFTSCGIALVFEVILCIALSIRGIQGFAYYLSGSTVVAQITQRIWKQIDWTYIFYGLNYQLAAILLAASPRWYLYQALGSNFLWMLPWAIFATVMSVSKSAAWTYYAIIFGGALVFDFMDVSITLAIWALRLSRGRVKVGALRQSSDLR